MTEPLDLAELERLCAAATPGPWSYGWENTRGITGTSAVQFGHMTDHYNEDSVLVSSDDGDGSIAPDDPQPITAPRTERPLEADDVVAGVPSGERRDADGALIVALRNAAPALLSRLRALERVAAAATSTLKWAREFCEERGCEGGTPDGSCPDYKEVIDDWCDPCRVWRAVEASDAALKEAGL